MENHDQFLGDEIGLCKRCLHSRVITSAKGRGYYLCELSKRDPTYPRYPPLPVLSCQGYEVRADEGHGGAS